MDGMEYSQMTSTEQLPNGRWRALYQKRGCWPVVVEADTEMEAEDKLFAETDGKSAG